MKFITSLCCAILLSIILILLLGLILKCDHNNIIEVYSFQPESSTALSYVKSVCEDCEQGFHTTLFRNTPPDEKYISVIEEHCKDEIFVKGGYNTMQATVTLLDYNTHKTEINCSVQQHDVKVYFSVAFKEEYEETVSSLQVGDKITFYGKSALESLSFTDCELIIN